MKNFLLITTLVCLTSAQSFALTGKCTPGSVGTGFSGTTAYCQGAVATALTYNYAECASGAGAATGVACTATWYYNTTNTTAITGSTVTVSGPTAFTAANGVNGNLPTVTPSTTNGGIYYYYCVVSWVAAGTCSGPYTTGTQLVTITQLPGAINGTAATCVSATTTLSDNLAGGTWASSNAAVATINASGVVSGVAAGTVTISYTVAGCKVTRVVSSNPLPATISGAVSVCSGATVTYNDATPAGTWSSSNALTATIATNGVVTGIAGGTSMITYALATGCARTATITVNQSPTAINGARTVCAGSTTTLTDVTTGGTWKSSVTSVAAANASTGVITGALAGNVSISYILPTGCQYAETFTVNAVPSGISGAVSVCLGLTSTVSDVTAGGTWSSSNGTVATIGTTGIINSLSIGATTITYTAATGCYKTFAFSVVAGPGAINGTKSVCPGATRQLSDATASGTWTTTTPAVANISSGGLVTGVAAGTTTISYKLASGCYSATQVTVIPVPAVITGATTACSNGAAVAQSDASSTSYWTGTWSSSNTSNATIGSATGTVNGLSAGTTTISFVTGCGTTATRVLTVIASPATITGTVNVCIGLTTALTSATTGGTWSSNNTALATVGASTGIVTGKAQGSPVITYTGTNGCTTTTTTTVNTLPATVTASGAGTYCATATVSASNGGDGTIYFQGTTSGGTSTATPGASQVVHASGTYYFRALSASGCWSAEGSVTVTVNQLTAITNVSFFCPSTSITLSDPTTGGTWSSSNTSVATVNPSTGVVYGVAGGTTVITYSTGAACNATTVLTVSLPPSVATSVIAPIVKGMTSTRLNFHTTGTPSNYSITWSPAAIAVGFSNVSGGRLDTLAVDTILHVSLPSTAIAAVYTGTLSVTSHVCVSPGSPIRTIITDSLDIATFAGNGTSGYTGNGGAATHAKITHPSAVASDCSGNTYIADYDNGVVRKVDATGVITTIAGNGTIGYSGDNGLATSAQLSQPTGIALDNAGNIYISDYSNMVVRKVDAAGIITTFAGNGGHGFSGDNGLATDAMLNYPVGLAVDNDNNVYITDYLNSAIRKVDADGIITTVAGTGIAGFSGDGGSATNARLNNPRSVAVDAAGNLFIADYSNEVIRKVTASGVISTIAGLGIAGYSGDGNNATYAQINDPWGIAVDGYGNVYFSELHNNVIRKIDTAGLISTIAGSNSQGFSGDGSIGISAQLNQPMGISINCSGNLFIADNANYAVRVLGTYNRLPFFTNGSTQHITVSENTSNFALSSLLSVTDFDTTQAETWAVGAEAAHGTLAISYTTSTTGGTLVPSGLTYTPNFGYTGADEFTVQVSDGKSIVTTTVSVNVTPAAGRMAQNTGVENTTTPASLQVFPNPTRGAFNIKTSGEGTFYLYSIEGKVVGTYPVTGEQTSVTIPNGLPSGIYIGRFTTTSNSTVDVKLVYEQ